MSEPTQFYTQKKNSPGTIQGLNTGHHSSIDVFLDSFLRILDTQNGSTAKLQQRRAKSARRESDRFILV